MLSARYLIGCISSDKMGEKVSWEKIENPKMSDFFKGYHEYGCYKMRQSNICSAVL